MRHRHLQSHIITDSWSLDRFSLALLEHYSLSSKSLNEQQNHALSILNTFTLSENCSLPLFSWLLLDSIKDDSCLRQAERLSTLISTALDHRILTFLSQSLFHHHSADLELCCNIDWDLSADADCRDEASVEQEHNCYTINEENVSFFIIIAWIFQQVCLISRFDKNWFWAEIWWHDIKKTERKAERRWWAEVSQWRS